MHDRLRGQGHADRPGQEKRHQRPPAEGRISPAHALNVKRHVGFESEQDAADQKTADQRRRDHRPSHQVHGQDRVGGVVLANHEGNEKRDRGT